MKLIDELYNMYSHILTGDEEDADIIVFSILEALKRQDLLQLIEEMNEQELFGMVGMYMLEKFKSKMAQEGVGRVQMIKETELKNLH
ncbi:MAG TPA: cytosolic protein [Bacillus bacterium]|nr:cytosolic protein [Bacillus sp. (in: firmicutes)]